MPDLYVEADGTIRGIYSDQLIDVLRRCGKVRIRRASHVEPTPGGEWVADLAPVGGPVLGPYALRNTALQEEVKELGAMLSGAKVNA